MSERHSCLTNFDRTNNYQFGETCNAGTPLDESRFAAYGIQRLATSEGTETTFANGISVTRHKEGDFELAFSAKLKYNEDENGLSKIFDKNGKVAAYLSAEGNVLIPSKDKVLQENKYGEISLNDISCFEKDPTVVIENGVRVIVMPEMVITGRVPSTESKPNKTDGHSKTDSGKKDAGGKDSGRRDSGRKDSGRKDSGKNGETCRTDCGFDLKSFNWDSDDPLEGIDVSGY